MGGVRSVEPSGHVVTGGRPAAGESCSGSTKLFSKTVAEGQVGARNAAAGQDLFPGGLPALRLHERAPSGRFFKQNQGC